MKESSTSIIVAVIGAVASVLAALISSGYFAKQNVQEEIRKIDITQKQVWEKKNPGDTYMADSAGIVVAIASANPQHRAVYLKGKINNEVVAATAAQDSTDNGVPSILNSSITMPVPRGAEWVVDVDKKDISQVEVKWFSTTAEITPPKP